MDNPSVRAGDPFDYAASRQDHDEHPHEAPAQATHACIDGWVYLGFEGEYVEELERVPCRRCTAGR